MLEEKTYTLGQAHLHFAMDFHAKTWELLDKPERTRDEEERMVDYAHASLAHWRVAGTAARHQRGEWMLARVYTVLGNAPLAVQHARRCLEILEANAAEMTDFDYAFAYEAMARAYALQGERAMALHYLEMAQQAGNAIVDEEDRQVFFDEFTRGNWHGLR
jgi:tetratricopeptide (TPR) repeat protein